MIRRVSASGEWAQEAQCLMEEVGEHLASGEGREEIVLVTFDDGGAFIPEVVTVEKNVVGCVSVAAVRACSVVAGVHSKAR